MPVIEINHLTKEYRLGALKGLKQTLLDTGVRLLGKPVPERPLFKALDDVSFSVEAGEVVGIIGHNGAGKSTLLKMLAGISTPTHGSVKVNGRIAPLIEVGAGFLPEFTGRENVYLNGAILGMSKKEIDSKFDEIVDFAEMAEFIDTPVKRYSSGMKVKLAFAVATSVESEILIVDEVLAVGDLAFQRKCFDRMEGLIQRSSRTVLLVSHNIRQVERMCSRVMLLDHGKVAEDGRPLAVCEEFYRRANDSVFISNQQNRAASRVNSSGELDIASVEVLDADGTPVHEIESGKCLRVRVAFDLTRDFEQLEIIVGTHTTDFIYLSAASTAALTGHLSFSMGRNEIEYIVKSFPLVSGVYCIRVAMFDHNKRLLFSGETLRTFKVTPGPNELLQPPMRTLNLMTEWKIPANSHLDENHQKVPLDDHDDSPR